MKKRIFATIIALSFSCQQRYSYDPNETLVYEEVSPPAIALPVIPDQPKSQQQIIKGSYNVVYFKYNSSQIDAVYQKNLSIIATYLKKNPEYSLNINGHTDSKGSKKYNKKLSEKRAAAVRDYLISLGIDNKRLNTFGLAFTYPYRPEKTPRDQAYNRRVEINFLKN